jgi:hypothetical protein
MHDQIVMGRIIKPATVRRALEEAQAITNSIPGLIGEVEYHRELLARAEKELRVAAKRQNNLFWLAKAKVTSLVKSACGKYVRPTDGFVREAIDDPSGFFAKLESGKLNKLVVAIGPKYILLRSLHEHYYTRMPNETTKDWKLRQRSLAEEFGIPTKKPLNQAKWKFATTPSR